LNRLQRRAWRPWLAWLCGLGGSGADSEWQQRNECESDKVAFHSGARLSQRHRQGKTRSAAEPQPNGIATKNTRTHENKNSFCAFCVSSGQ
jgi:hypothetical protein